MKTIRAVWWPIARERASSAEPRRRRPVVFIWLLLVCVVGILGSAYAAFARSPHHNKPKASTGTQTGIVTGATSTLAGTTSATGTPTGGSTAAGVTTAGLPPTSANATGTVIVNATSPTGQTLSTQLSTNNVWSGMLDQAPNGQQLLDELHAPLVRIHVGDDGWPEAMPEIKYNQWNFGALDALISDVTHTGQQPLVNIKFAPDYMWTCYPNSAGVDSNGSQGVGTVKDLTFNTFAQYMARLVSYYNKGSMTTETGQVITNPAGTNNRVTWWELWNEPDLNNETPCAPSDGLGLTASQYVTMWNAVTSAMLAVDPTLRFVGPATSGGQFGSSESDSYIPSLMAGAKVAPSAISFHGYGYWDNTVTDQTIFDGDNTGSGGIAEIVNDTKTIRARYPNIPIWMTEVNVNADWGNDALHRPWNAFGAAWWATTFQQVAPLGVGLINQYDLVDSPQFGLIDDQTGTPRLPFWEIMLLDQGFPAGSHILSSTSSQSGILSLAVQQPNGTISVLVINRQLNSASAKGGPGVPATIQVDLQGITPTAITLRQIDSATNPSTGPATETLAANYAPLVSFMGYGFAVLTIQP